MSDQQIKYETQMLADFPKVRVTSSEITDRPIYENGTDTGRKERCLRVKFWKTTKSKRNRDYCVEVTVPIGKRVHLEKIQKGDYVAVKSNMTGMNVRLYASQHKNAFNGVDIAVEINNPMFFEALTDLRTRPDGAAPAEEPATNKWDE